MSLQGAVCKPPRTPEVQRNRRRPSGFNEGAVCKPPGPEKGQGLGIGARSFNEGAVCKPPGPLAELPAEGGSTGLQ